MTEQELVAAALDGDVGARNQVVESMALFIKKKAFEVHRMDSSHSIEDLEQEAFCQVLNKFHKLDPSKGNRPISYLGVVAINAMLSYLPRDHLIRTPRTINSSRCRKAAAKSRSTNHLLPDSGYLERDCLEEAEFWERYEVELERLPRATRRVLELYAAGRSYREIGKVLGFSRGKACNLAREGRDVLREALA